ncbi:phosphatidylserine/phosphatidylglycerophosphate/cardiolipin synthase family protein [Micrococcus endophyticus]|uniref:phospholipase D-like domain-containing protein n=1 Tax=Micrococcus endophyticus TaxID=455343 RepID=UPI0035A92FC4
MSPLPASPLHHIPVRRIVRGAALAAGTGLVGVPMAVAAGLTGVDMVKRRGRRRRPAHNPGVFDAPVKDSHLRIFTSGEDLYEEMLAAIDSAERIVKFETYIWKADPTGQRFIEAFNRAAARGVEVYVSYDGFGNLVVPRAFYRQLDPRIRVFRLPAFARPFWRGPVRNTGFNHSKIMVVDDEIGFVGGFNIGDDYATFWRDTHVCERGPAVWALDQSISIKWNAHHREGEQMSWRPPESWDPRVTVSANQPPLLVYPIRLTYLEAIQRAQHRILINTPYFIPDQQVLQALLHAARRGVDVQVMVPLDSNHIVADWASRGFYAEMLEAGITILLYKASMIHAKTATVDGIWSTVGTANIDRLSLGFNYESNVVVVDRDFAARMEEIFAIDAEQSERVESPRWQDRHGVARMVERLLVPLRPLL